MTAHAVQARPALVPVRVPAVASLVLKHLFSSGDVNATVLGASSHAVWLLVGGDVVVVSTRDATRLPNSVEVAARSGAGLFDSVAHGESVVVGRNSLEFGGFFVELVRWWDPRPALPGASIGDIASAICGLPHAVPAINSGPLRSALAAGSPDHLVGASAGLLGRGPGLTPEGDDVLAGALAAIRTLGTALGSRPALAMLDESETALVDAANDRTTTFSAALISCAARGEVAAPAGTFLRALAGRGHVGSSHRDLLRVGHTSGPALAAGIVLGAQALIELHTTPNGGAQ
jgi:hypothetical protein